MGWRSFFLFYYRSAAYTHLQGTVFIRTAIVSSKHSQFLKKKLSYPHDKGVKDGGDLVEWQAGWRDVFVDAPRRIVDGVDKRRRAVHSGSTIQDHTRDFNTRLVMSNVENCRSGLFSPKRQHGDLASKTKKKVSP